MKKIILYLSALVVGGCAAIPFQKTKDGIGYEVIGGKTKDTFSVKISLPKGSNERRIQIYTARAIGEECLFRGFEFYDRGDVSEFEYVGYCFKQSGRKAMAISFKNIVDKDGSSFIVEDLNNKSKTNLKVGDQVLSFAGSKMTSVNQIKQAVFDLTHQGHSGDIPMLIKRDGKEISIKEPLADFANSNSTPENLKALRDYII